MTSQLNISNQQVGLQIIHLGFIIKWCLIFVVFSLIGWGDLSVQYVHVCICV